MSSEPRSLVVLSQGERMLAEAATLDDLRHVRDLAVAASHYARVMKLGVDAQKHAVEIASVASRRMAELDPPAPRGRGKKMSAPADILPPKQRRSENRDLLEFPSEDDLRSVVRKLEDPSLSRVKRLGRDKRALKRRDARENAKAAALASELRCEPRLGDLRTALDDLCGQVDAIITDPPYPKEFLPLFADLADLADRLLKPDGVLAVMVGQAHLPTVYRLLDGKRPYRWTLAYMTPGPDGIVHGNAHIASAWKPVIVYGGGRRGVRDVITSKTDNKSAHHWQQDLDGFIKLVDVLTEPGALVVDPFMGSGTTLVAARACGRHAVGCDIDPAAVASAHERVAA